MASPAWLDAPTPENQSHPVRQTAVRIATWVGPLVAYTMLAVLLFGASWAHPTSAWIGNDGDPKIFMWYLGWIPHQLAQLHSPLVTDWLMFPTGVNIMWNTSIVLPSLILWPITATAGLVFAYNLLATSALVLSAWLMFVATNRLVHQLLAAFVAGALYGFSPYMLAHSLGHVHVTLALYPPLVLILMDEILLRQRRRAWIIGGLLGLASVCQLLTGEEVLATTVITAGVGTLILVLLRPLDVAPRISYALKALGCALVVFTVLAAYPLKVQFLGPNRIVGTLQSPELYVTDFYNFFIPNGMVWFTPTWAMQISSRFTGNGTETTGYLGVPLLVLLGVAALLGRRRLAMRWSALLAVAMATLSLGPHLHRGGHIGQLQLPWAALVRLPILADILPGRLMLFAFLAAALMLGIFLADAFGAGRGPALLTSAFTLVALVPLIPSIPFLSTPDTTPTFFRPGGEVERIPAGSVALITPFSNGASSTAMYWQATAAFRFRMPEGEAYIPGPTLFSPPPSSLQDALVAFDAGQNVSLTADSRQAALNDLHRFRVRTVVVGPSPGRASIERWFSAFLDRPPEHTGGVAVWWNLDSGAGGPGHS